MKQIKSEDLAFLLVCTIGSSLEHNNPTLADAVHEYAQKHGFTTESLTEHSKNSQFTEKDID